MRVLGGKISMSEKDLVNSILEYLRLKGHFAWRNNSGFVARQYITKSGQIRKSAFRASIPGASDILGVHKPDGRLMAIECKVGRNKPTDDQIDFLESVGGCGGIAFVAYDLADVRRTIE